MKEVAERPEGAAAARAAKAEAAACEALSGCSSPEGAGKAGRGEEDWVVANLDLAETGTPLI